MADPPRGRPPAYQAYPEDRMYYEQPPPPYREPYRAEEQRAELLIPPAPLGLVALHDLWRKTTGSISLDLKRRQWKGGVPGRDSLWRVNPPLPGSKEPAYSGRRRRGFGRPPARAQPTYYGQQPPQQPYGQPQQPYGQPPQQYGGGGYPGPAVAAGGGYAPAAPRGGGGYAPPRGAYGTAGGGYRGGDLFELPSVSFMDTGARFKVMRHVAFGPSYEATRSSGVKHRVPAVDLGVGFAFELDSASVEPQVRVKIRDYVSLKMLPYPALKINKRLALPDSSWGIRASYECPLDELHQFWRPPARLMLSIDNMHRNGAQLTQAGLEFNYAADMAMLGGGTYLRAQGLVALPRELPLEAGQPFAALELKRLGIKWRW